MIDRRYIDDNDVIARYLADRLSDEEREGFEAYYLEHPEMLQELNRTAQFKSGLVDLQKSGELNRLIENRSWWQRVGGLAVAASVVLTIVGAGIWFNWQNRPTPILAASTAALVDSSQPVLPIAGRYTLETTRTSSYDATIQLPINPAAIELKIRPEIPAERYRLRLARITQADARTSLAELDNLRPTADGLVTTYLNTRDISPGVYELGIASSSERNVETSFYVEIVAAPAK